MQSHACMWKESKLTLKHRPKNIQPRLLNKRPSESPVTFVSLHFLNELRDFRHIGESRWARLEEHQTFSDASQTAFVAAGPLHGRTSQFRTLGAMEDQTHLLTNKEQRQGTAILQTIHDLKNAKLWVGFISRQRDVQNAKRAILVIFTR